MEEADRDPTDEELSIFIHDHFSLLTNDDELVLRSIREHRTGWISLYRRATGRAQRVADEGALPAGD